MVRILRAYGVPPNLLRAIDTMNAGTSARVVTPDGNSEEFDIWAGVMQGDRRAGSGLHSKTKEVKRHPKIVLTDLDYANDI